MTASENSKPAPHVADHVGHALAAYNEEGRAVHKLAIAYLEKANAEGKRPTYRDAITAVTRRGAVTR